MPKYCVQILFISTSLCVSCGVKGPPEPPLPTEASVQLPSGSKNVEKAPVRAEPKSNVKETEKKKKK